MLSNVVLSDIKVIQSRPKRSTIVYNDGLKVISMALDDGLSDKSYRKLS